MIHEAWKAGHVRRWHANPDLCHINDTTAAHAGRMAVMALQFFPNDAWELFPAIAAHDNAEDVTGDVPFTFKHNNQDIAETIQKIEIKTLIKRGLAYVLSEDGYKRLKFLDRLDAYKTMLHYAPHLASQDVWIEASSRLSKLAVELDVLGQLHEAMNVY
jgi:hypothetical protein